MTRYDFLEAGRAIYNNVIWFNFYFGWLFFMWIGANNDQIYDFLEAGRVIMNNVRTDSNLT